MRANTSLPEIFEKLEEVYVHLIRHLYVNNGVNKAPTLLANCLLANRPFPRMMVADPAQVSPAKEAP